MRGPEGARTGPEGSGSLCEGGSGLPGPQRVPPAPRHPSPDSQRRQDGRAKDSVPEDSCSGRRVPSLELVVSLGSLSFSTCNKREFSIRGPDWLSPGSQQPRAHGLEEVFVVTEWTARPSLSRPGVLGLRDWTARPQGASPQGLFFTPVDDVCQLFPTSRASSAGDAGPVAASRPTDQETQVQRGEGT